MIKEVTMKKLSLILTAVLLLAGCASLEEAYYIDKEFGQDSQATWDRQVMYPDYRFAHKTPETIEGVTAEEIMKVYNDTFAEKPEQINVLGFGLED
jgi:PBP1b-binding outer membrane lipoprotein LpoB